MDVYINSHELDQNNHERSWTVLEAVSSSTVCKQNKMCSTKPINSICYVYALCIQEQHVTMGHRVIQIAL